MLRYTAKVFNGLRYVMIGDFSNIVADMLIALGRRVYIL